MADRLVSGPNPIRVAWSIVQTRRLRPPRRFGSADVDHADFAMILEQLRHPRGLRDVDTAALDAYLHQLAEVDPNELSREAALAYWINLYNAAAIRLARAADDAGFDTVLRLPGAFDARELVVGGETLSLNDVEHGKIRRFGDPRIHAALVCGSLSCPTLRPEPFEGWRVGAQLDDQMRRLLASGAAIGDREQNHLLLSRIFLWYGADFVRPHRMPTLLPARPRRTAVALTPWMDEDLASWVTAVRPKVVFQPYDWGLGCTVA